MQASGGNGKDKIKPALGKGSKFLGAQLVWASLYTVTYGQAPTGAAGLWALETIYSSYLVR